jgi:hypothetical protein
MCLNKFEPESIQFHRLRIIAELLIIAQIEKLFFCQITITDMFKRYGKRDPYPSVSKELGEKVKLSL